jgi:hypothetical protein
MNWPRTEWAVLSRFRRFRFGSAFRVFSEKNCGGGL